MGVGGQRHAPAALLQLKKSSNQCTGGSVIPRVGVDVLRIFCPNQASLPGPSSP